MQSFFKSSIIHFMKPWTDEKTKTEIISGMKDSLPIMAGYFSVSFTFGIMAASYGMAPWIAGLISFTNITSAGQFAGVQLMAAAGGTTVLEMFLTQLVINLRYGLMSLSLSQRLVPGVGTLKRMLIAYINTDEIFAVAASRPMRITPSYMFGLEVGPILCWTAGTISGAAFRDLLPPAVQSALGVALYGMFIAIVLPPVRKNKHIAIVAGIALLISVLLYYVPALSGISSGFAVIICTLLAAGVGAALFPVRDADKSSNS